MKMVQGDQDAHGAEEADEPPAVDNGFSFDIQDEEMIEKGGCQDAGHKARGHQRAICRAYDGKDEGDEDENRQQVQEMEYGADVEEPDQLAARMFWAR